MQYMFYFWNKQKTKQNKASKRSLKKCMKFQDLYATMLRSTLDSLDCPFPN